MDLIIVGGAGTKKEFYNIALEEFEKNFSKINVFSLEGNCIDEMSNNIFNDIKDIKEDFVLVGHCLGGMAIINMLGNLKLRTDHIKGLVLCNSYYNCTSLTINQLTEGRPLYVMAKHSHIIKPTPVLRQQLDICISTNLSSYISKIDVPTLILGGTRDISIPINYLIDEYDKLADSHIRIIKGGNHAMIVHSTKLVNRYIKEFADLLEDKEISA